MGFFLLAAAVAQLLPIFGPGGEEVPCGCEGMKIEIDGMIRFSFTVRPYSETINVMMIGLSVAHK